MHVRPATRTATLPATLLLAALALTGCANMTTTALDDTSAPSSLSGIVHGGRQPVANATVTLWAAGNAGYGSTAASLATTSTDANGNFAFQPTPGYSCPSTTSTTASQYLYLTVSGGQPTTGITNSQAAFLLALGSCSAVKSANPTVNIDELTTVASITALQQFFKPNTTSGLGSIGTSSTNITGLANAMALVPNMVNTATGQSFATTTASAAVTGYTTNPVITITPEQSKLDTMADILAACVNTSGSNATTPTACNTLYANAGSATPLDTLQAAYYMATTPAGVGTAASCTTGTAVTTAPSICTLYGLVTSSAPYQPTLAAAPTDWTLGISYSSTSTSTASVNLLTKTEYVAIDAAGNVWLVNLGSTTAVTNNSVTELSNSGTPLNQVFAAAIINPSYISIDPSGNVFVPYYGASGAGTSVLEYTTSGSTKTFTTNKGPQRLAIDGNGNVFVVEPSYKGLGNLEEIPAGAATGTSATTLATGLTTDFSNLAIDSNYNIWITGGGTGALGGTAGYPYIYQFLYSSTSPNYPSTPSATTNVGSVTVPENAIAIDNSNNVFVQNYGKETVSEFSGTTTVSGNANSPYTMPTLLAAPEFEAIDGAGNQWITDAASTGSVFETTSAGVAISPSVGFTKSSYYYPYGVAIDSSGNVWIGSENTAAYTPLTELVGAAAPVGTPLSADLPTTPGGTSKLGTRP